MPESTPRRPDRKDEPALVHVRSAVRPYLREVQAGGLVLVAASGGADSMALADAAAFEGSAAGIRVGAVIVDHGLAHDSDQVAATVAGRLRALGLDPVTVVPVQVAASGEGLEAAARAARYAAIDQVAAEAGADVILLGHTLDDQAEQVLLGLARGSGARSLSGMPPERGRYRRPLLGLRREATRAAVAARGIDVWEDPMNADAAYARVRARRALADLEADLGPGLADALARSADLLRADADYLDEATRLARDALGPGPWKAAALAAVPDAIRGRLWRRLLIEAGSPPGSLGSRHVAACDALVVAWRGQGPIHVPGHLAVSRVEHSIVVSDRRSGMPGARASG